MHSSLSFASDNGITTVRWSIGSRSLPTVGSSPKKSGQSDAYNVGMGGQSANKCSQCVFDDASSRNPFYPLRISIEFCAIYTPSYFHGGVGDKLWCD